jgi:hypothetical protein
MNDIEHFVNAMSGNSRFIASLFAQFVSLPCEHDIPCKDCQTCWQKICAELKTDQNIDRETGRMVKL